MKWRTMDSNEEGLKYFYTGDAATSYLANRADEVKWFREQEIVKGIVDRYMLEGSVVLDVPFGTGRFADYYIEKGLKVFGLDISRDMLDVARRQLGSRAGNVELIQGDAGDLPFGPDSVDYLVCVRLLNWVSMDNIERFLREFARVTDSLMILGIRTINTAGVSRRAGKSISRRPFYSMTKAMDGSIRLARKKFSAGRHRGEWLGNSTNFFFHRKPRFDKLLDTLGLEIIEVDTVDEYDSNPLWVVAPLQVYVLRKNRRAAGVARNERGAR